MLKMFEGYVTEIDYIPWYHRNLAPLLLRAAARNHPISLPTGRPLRYLELGYGNGGIALNIHAAASPGEYWGIDVNPSHVASANILADASGSGLRVLGGSSYDGREPNHRVTKFSSRGPIPQPRTDRAILHLSTSDANRRPRRDCQGAFSFNQ